MTNLHRRIVTTTDNAVYKTPRTAIHQILLEESTLQIITAIKIAVLHTIKEAINRTNIRIGASDWGIINA